MSEETSSKTTQTNGGNEVPEISSITTFDISSVRGQVPKMENIPPPPPPSSRQIV
jgi:hypothetical protein